MFEFRTGLPGSGKSLSLVRDIYWKLVYSNRMVGTTLTELDPGKLTAYIAAKHPGENFNIERRLFFIPKAETSTFYRFRGTKTFEKPPRIPKTASVEEKEAICEAYFKQFDGMPGVDYFLTEAHRHFKADTWSEMSDVVMFYASQHRHLDDNVCVETQVPKMVVVQFRDLAEICVEMQNHYRQRFGYFQKIGRFVAVYYYGVPKPGTKGEVSHTTTFLLDKAGLAGCYATRGAITGVGGATPETDTVKKGLPFWTIPILAVVALVVISVAIWFSGDAFKWAMEMVGKKFLPMVKTTTEQQAAKITGMEPSKETVQLENGTEPPPETPGDKKDPPEKVWLRSASMQKRRAVFVLTNGIVWSEKSPEMKGATFDPRTGVLTLANGTTYTLKR